MNFALISEGVTDRPVIEASIYAFFSKFFTGVTPFINPLQPKDKDPGGWTRVLAYCASEEFKKAFELNKYVIIQIDSDRHLEKGYDVAKQANDLQLIQAIQQRIIESIGRDFYNTVSDRIIFAVSINSIECWLLPFYATTAAHKSKSYNCCTTLNTYLKKHDYTINCGTAEGSYPYYVKASEPITNKKDFFSGYKFNQSLKYFVENELTKIKP